LKDYLAVTRFEVGMIRAGKAFQSRATCIAMLPLSYMETSWHEEGRNTLHVLNGSKAAIVAGDHLFRFAQKAHTANAEPLCRLTTERHCQAECFGRTVGWYEPNPLRPAFK
jgi:hypothetical protein